jgi:hypothetical protein
MYSVVSTHCTLHESCFVVSPVTLLRSLCRSEKGNYSQADYLYIRAAEKHVSLWGLGGLRNNTVFLKKKTRNIQKQGRGGVLVLEILNILWGPGTEEDRATEAGGIHSLESIPGLHKCLKIRALEFLNN